MAENAMPGGAVRAKAYRRCVVHVPTAAWREWDPQVTCGDQVRFARCLIGIVCRADGVQPINQDVFRSRGVRARSITSIEPPRVSLCPVQAGIIRQRIKLRLLLFTQTHALSWFKRDPHGSSEVVKTLLFTLGPDGIPGFVENATSVGARSRVRL